MNAPELDSPPPPERKNPLWVLFFGALAGLVAGLVGYHFFQGAPQTPEPSSQLGALPPQAPLKVVPRASLSSGGGQEAIDMIIQSPSLDVERRADSRKLKRAASRFHSIVRRFGSRAFIEEWTREFFTYPDLKEIYRKYDHKEKRPLKFAFGVLSSPNFYRMLRRNLANPNIQNIMRGVIADPALVAVATDLKDTRETKKILNNYSKMTGIPFTAIVDPDAAAQINVEKVTQDAIDAAIRQGQEDAAYEQNRRR